jgi:hypothetical protein
MVRREIEIDEDTNRLLTELASEYKGDLGLALTDLVHAREGLEDFAEGSGAAHENVLRTLRDRSDGNLGRRHGPQRVVKILFAAAAVDGFDELPPSTKRKAASSIELLEQHPRMYPGRRRGMSEQAAGRADAWSGSARALRTCADGGVGRGPGDRPTPRVRQGTSETEDWWGGTRRPPNGSLRRRRSSRRCGLLGR